MSANLTIRPATPEDISLILSFIRELAEYERLLDQAVLTEEQLRIELFGPNPVAEAVLAFCGDTPAGFALFFHNFSTFLGKRGLYLEDLFVRPEFRGKGIGKALLLHLAQIAVERGCGRFEWSALDWNTPAIDFYLAQGAVAKDEWTTFQLVGEALGSFANPD